MQGGFERNMPKKGLVVVCYERGVTCPAKLSDSFKSNRLAHFLQATVNSSCEEIDKGISTAR